MVTGIDTCAAVSASAARKLYALGYRFVGRYLAPPSEAKAITQAEAARIRKAWLGVLLIWETTANRANQGSAAGTADGAAACIQARGLGVPDGTMIYFAVDYDAREPDFDNIERYLRAARDFCRGYETGVYGSFRVVEEMRRRGVCRGFWQCVAWSGGQLSTARTVYQREWQEGPEALAVKAKVGFAVDVNECRDPTQAGIWMPEEDKMTGKEIYEALREYTATLPLPAWAKDELAEAQALGITDGTRPMDLIPRYQAAILAKRAVKAAVSELPADDYYDDRPSGLLEKEE